MNISQNKYLIAGNVVHICDFTPLYSLSDIINNEVNVLPILNINTYFRSYVEQTIF